MSAEEGDIEIVYEQLPATVDEVTEEVAGEPETDEETGFDALLSSEELAEGLDSPDLEDSAAHLAELHAHTALGGRNGKSVNGARNGNGSHSQSSAAHHGRMR